MTSFLPELSLYGLLPLSMGAVAVGGVIAIAEASRRKQLQRLLASDGDANARREEIARIEKELQTRRAQLAELDQREIEAQQHITQASRLQSQIADLERQRDQLAEVETRLRSLNEAVEDARTQRNIAQAQLSETQMRDSSLQANCTVMESQKQQLTSELETLKRERSELGSKLELLRQEASEAIAQRESASSSLAEVEKRTAAAEARSAAAESRIPELERSRIAIEEELREKSLEIAQAQAELSSCHTEQQRLQQLEIDAKTTLEKLEGLAEQQEEYDHLQEQIRTAGVKLADLQATQQAAILKAQEAEEDVVRLMARMELLTLEHEKLSGQLSDSEHGREIAIERLADVWKPVLPPSDQVLSNADEIERLDATRAYLKDHGLIFADRVLYAFHSALKVSAEATLLILAGISGTGKSLLPQRYAEGMGMNFLLLPVQPRWDGPQDLLGFYNFLQDKYVATDLIRALAQMHEYPEDWNLPEGSQHKSLRDQMLLVLLDEMNLARIEYYFSDLLVKLETRRTIRASVPNERRKASIELNTGPIGLGSAETFHVFPGQNCLFVGTMNEDESTQSISDKVVDRANVMRFAKPKVLHGKSSAEEVETPDGRLRFSDWQRWQDESKLTAADEERVNTIVERLNEAMNNVERPFGHRVKQAIVQYVKMYPHRSSTDLNHAIADQIEMRILPKLRGIELDDRATECITTIEEIVADLDQDLAAAIADAQHPESMRFHWLGISRDVKSD